MGEDGVGEDAATESVVVTTTGESLLLVADENEP
jgi:hypothetical protein